MGREVRDFQGARELLGRGKFSAVWVLLGFCLGLASCSGSLSFHTLGSILFSNQSSDSGHTQNQDGSPFDGIQGLSLDPADIHLILMDGQQSVEDVVSVGDTISHSITIEKDGNDISSQYFSNPALTQVFAIMNPLGVELGECESPYTQFLIESDPCEALYAGLLDVQLTDPSQFDLWVTGGLQGLTIPYFMFAMRFNTSGDVVSIAISDEMSLLQIHSQSGSGDYDIDLTQDPWTDSVEEHQLIHTGALADGSTQVIQGNDEVTFRYTGSDETISYRVNYSPGSPVAKGTVRVEELTSGSIPLAEGNVRYRSSNGGLEGPAYLPLFASIENVSVQNQKLLIDYRDPVEGQVLRRRHTYEMKGKTLRVSVEAIGDTALNRNFNGNYSGFTTGKSEQTLTPRRMYMQGTLAAPIVSFKNNGQLYFYSNQLDFLWSNASNFFLPDPYSPSLTWNTSNFSFNTGGQYEKTSAGKLAATLRESVSIVVSKNIKDVLVRSTQRVSPYRELLTQKNVVRFNDGNSDAADMIPWSDFAESMQDLYNYGADQLAFYFFFFWTGSELEGKQNVGPEWAPGHIVLNDGVHENIRTHFSNVGNSLGYMMGLYTFFGAAPSGTLPGADYSGSVFFDLCLSPFDPACIEQHILKDENGQPKIGSFSGTQWELLSDSAVLDYYIDRETQIMSGGWSGEGYPGVGSVEESGYGMNLIFVDSQTMSVPSTGHDYLDQTEGSPHPKTIRDAIMERKRWMQRAKQNIGGPLLGEGSIATYNSNTEYIWTEVDGHQRVINTGAGIKASQVPSGDPLAIANWPVIPEYELRVFQQAHASFGNGFPDRFFSSVHFPISESKLDYERAYHITYAHLSEYGHNSGQGTYTTHRERVKSFYMMNALTKRMFASPVQDIRYRYTINGSDQMRTFEEVLNHDYGASLDPLPDKFKDPQLKMVYENGLEVYVNHSTEEWEKMVNGVLYRIPEDGFVAVKTDEDFVAFSAKIQQTWGPWSHRFDYVRSPEYSFFDGRGDQGSYAELTTLCPQNGTTIKNYVVENRVHNLRILEGKGNNGHPCEEDSIQPLSPTPPEVVQLEAFPKSIKMSPGQVHGLRVVAHYDNGASQDVTTLVTFNSVGVGVALDGPAARALSVGSAQIQISSFGGKSATPIVVVVE